MADLQTPSRRYQRLKISVAIGAQRTWLNLLVPLHNAYDSLAEGDLALIGSG